ncbi:MAG: two pore domain potassium channel family protein [Thermoplasmata archaeon]|nr:MAG: two pore domain potassium channel family protein [Thermoplasmata archaeon]
MVGLLSILKKFISDTEFQRLSIFVILFLLAGAIFYHQVEGWGWLDSIYFCVTTLTTVGYGDFNPTTGAGKVFTILYIVVGIGILLGYVNIVAKIALQHNYGVIDMLTQKTMDISKRTIDISKRTVDISKRTKDIGKNMELKGVRSPVDKKGSDEESLEEPEKPESPKRPPTRPSYASLQEMRKMDYEIKK